MCENASMQKVLVQKSIQICHFLFALETSTTTASRLTDRTFSKSSSVPHKNGSFPLKK
jgi:hypothetical protein